MANNVYNELSLVSGNKDACREFNSSFLNIYSNYEENGLEYLHFLPDWKNDYADKNWFDYNIGADWAYVSFPLAPAFPGKSTNQVNITSGWKPPGMFFTLLGEHLHYIDPNSELMMTYVDEFYNFAGVLVYNDEGLQNKEMTNVELKDKFDHSVYVEPRDFPDFVEEITNLWGNELLNETRL